MASQVVVLVSRSQAQGGAVDALKDRVGKEYVLIRPTGPQEPERQVRRGSSAAATTQMALFDQPADGTTIMEIA